jgi:hypothetical protein
MRSKRENFHVRTFFAILVTLALGSSLRSAEPTAFELIKEGNRHIGELARDKVVQIRSERSVASLSPNIWWIVYYDPTAKLKATEVKFGAGKMLEVNRPMRLLEPVTGGDTPLDRDKLKIDSDKAIQIAVKEPLLEKLTITSTQLKLEKVGQGVLGTGGVGEAMWKVKLWAAKLRDPKRDTDIGEVWLSAADGKVLKNDLRIERVN